MPARKSRLFMRALYRGSDRSETADWARTRQRTTSLSRQHTTASPDGYDRERGFC